MKDQPSKTAITAWARLLRAQTLLLTQVEAALKAAGLPPLAWYDVLLELHRVRPAGLRQYEIGDKILLSKHNLSRLIDRLEGEGLVQRQACPEDGRGHVVRITEAGGAVLQRMWPVYGEAIHRLFEAKLADDEIVGLGEVLGKLVDGSETG